MAALAVVACAVPASASINYYADLPSFMAADVSAQQVSFDGLGVGSVFLNTTLSGITFSSTSIGSSPDLTVLANPGSPWPASPADVLAQNGFTANGSIVIQLPANVFGVALYAGYQFITEDLHIDITAGGDFSSVALNTSSSAPVFLGFRSDQAITSIALTYLGAPAAFKNIMLGGFQFDTVSGTDSGGGGGGGGGGETPESSSLFLMGAGLIALPLLRRRFSNGHV
jgi:hypothetical protein